MRRVVVAVFAVIAAWVGSALGQNLPRTVVDSTWFRAAFHENTQFGSPTYIGAYGQSNTQNGFGILGMGGISGAKAGGFWSIVPGSRRNIGLSVLGTGGSTGINIGLEVASNDFTASGMVGRAIQVDSGDVYLGRKTANGGPQNATYVYTLALDGPLMADGSAGTAGQFLISNGSGVAPTWQTGNISLNGIAWLLGGNTMSATQTLGTLNTYDLPIITDNVERMRITSAGNVGIGLATPAQLLDVRNGNLLLSNTGAAGEMQFQGTGTGITAFAAGAQGATNLTYTWPTTAPNSLDILVSTGGATSSLQWLDAQTLLNTQFVKYDVTSSQALATDRSHNLFNVAYGAGANDANATGAVITSTGGATDRSATALTLTATATGAGTATGLAVTASGGATNYAALFSGGNVGVGTLTPTQSLEVSGNALISSSGGTAHALQLQNPAGTFTSTFTAGAQTANIDYTLPITMPAPGNSGVLTTNSAGTLTWQPYGAGTSVISGNGTATQVAYFDGTVGNPSTSIVSSSNLFWDNTNSRLGVGTGSTVSATLHGIATDAATNSVTTLGILGHNTGGAAADGFGGALAFQLQSSTTANRDAAAIGALWTTAADATRTSALTFSTVNNGGAPAEAMRIAGTGNVGIGQTNPSQLLEVRNGNVLLSNSGTAGQLQLQNPGGSFTTTFAAGAQTANIDYTLPITMPTAGNSGVLTTTAAGTLSWQPYPIGYSVVSGNGTATEVAFFDGTVGNPSTAIVSSSNLFWDKTNNRLGIGTGSTVSAAMHAITADAATNTVATGTIVGHNTSGTAADGFGVATTYTLQSSTTANRDAAQIGALWTTAADATRTSALTFATVNNAGALAEAMRIAGNGSVGIGQPNPSQLLEVRNGNVLLSNNGTAGQLQLQNPGGTFATSFAAGAQAADINYTLPLAAPAANDYVLTSTTGGAMSWQDVAGLLSGAYVKYNVASAQASATPRGNNLFNVTYGAASPNADASGAVIASTYGSGAGDFSATGLSVSATASGAGAATGLTVSATGGANNYAALFTAGNVGVGTATPAALFSVGATSQFQVDAAGTVAAATGITSSGAITFSGLSAGGLVKATTGTGLLTLATAGTDYENPLTFSNALTRTVNAVTWGGPLTQNTTIPTAGFATAFTGTGNFGIGAAAPGAKLHVAGGNALIDTASAGAAGQLQMMNPARTFTTTFAAGAQTANIDYTLPITMPTVGNKGVLTTTATGTLAWQPYAAGYNVLAGGGTATQVAFFDGAVGSASNTVISSANLFWDNTNSRLGIGTGTTVSAALHAVTSDAATNSVTTLGILGHATSGAAANGFGGALNFQLQSSTTAGRDAAQVGAVWTDATDASRTSALTFATVNNAGALAEAMRIAGNGYVGVGQSNPSQLFEVRNGNLLLSNSGAAGQLQLQNPGGTFATTFAAGAQTANINYTLPIAAPAANNYVLTGTPAGTMSWQDPATLGNAWSLIGNAGTTPATNFLGTTDAQDMVVKTNGVERMRVANGNTVTLGIQGSGATAPPSSFTFGASGYVSPSAVANQSGTDFLVQSGAGTGNSATNGNIAFMTPAAGASGTTVQTLTERVRITNAGNVGIGTNNPSAMLSVGNTSQFQVNSAGSVAAATGITSSGSITFSGLSAGGIVKATGGTGLLTLATAGTDYENPLTFSNGLTRNVNAVTWGGTLTQNTTIATAGFSTAFTGSGNVGIGAATPGAKLHVAGGNALIDTASAGVAGQLQMMNPARTFATTFAAGAQTGAINYTLPTSLPAANNWVMTSSTGGTMSWQDPSTLLSGNYVQYNVSSQQAAATPRGNSLFNVAYASAATAANAVGATIASSYGSGGGNFNATGLTVTSTASGTGTSTGLSVTASGGTTNYAALLNGGNVGIGTSTPSQLVEVRNGNLLLSNSGSAGQLQLQNPGGTFATTFAAGAQSANINYTLPTAAPAVSGAVLSSTTGGVMSWSTYAGFSGSKGRVATTGALTQTIADAATSATGTILLTYEDPAGGALIGTLITTRTAGVSFTVKFTAMPPSGSYINYIILP